MSEDLVYATRSNRTLDSSRPTWAAAWGGALASKWYHYLPENYYINASVHELLGWVIHRGYLFFDTEDIPDDAVITAAKLGLYVVSHTPLAESYLCVTQGVQGDPVLPTEWANQNPYNTVGGQKLYSDLVDDQYNDIDLDADGLGWINAAGAIHKQFESLDSGENADGHLYGGGWWCQSFTPAVAHKINSVKLKMWRDGEPGLITVSIKAADASHFPTGPVLCSGTFNGDSITTVTPGAWYEITLGAGTNLSEGIEYVIELKALDGDVDNKVELRTTTAGKYLGGQAAYSTDGGSSWTPVVNYDLYFIEYNTLLASTKGTLLCLRNTHDVSNTEPVVGYDAQVAFHSRQKGELYAPKLTITYYHRGRSQAQIFG